MTPGAGPNDVGATLLLLWRHRCAIDAVAGRGAGPDPGRRDEGAGAGEADVTSGKRAPLARAVRSQARDGLCDTLS